jgi:hypothetical protein
MIHISIHKERDSIRESKHIENDHFCKIKLVKMAQLKQNFVKIAIVYFMLLGERRELASILTNTYTTFNIGTEIALKNLTTLT